MKRWLFSLIAMFAFGSTLFVLSEQIANPSHQQTTLSAFMNSPGDVLNLVVAPIEAAMPFNLYVLGVFSIGAMIGLIWFGTRQHPLPLIFMIGTKRAREPKRSFRFAKAKIHFT